MRLRASSSSNSAARAESADEQRRRARPRSERSASRPQFGGHGRVMPQRRAALGSLRRRRRCRRGGSRPTTSRRGPRGAAFPCRSSPSRSGSPCAPSSIISFLTASARFWPSAMLYSRVPRSSVLPCSVMLQRAVGLQVLGVRLDDRPVLVLDHELVVVEVDAALATGCCAGSLCGGIGRRACVPVTPASADAAWCVARRRSWRPSAADLSSTGAAFCVSVLVQPASARRRRTLR